MPSHAPRSEGRGSYSKYPWKPEPTMDVGISELERQDRDCRVTCLESPMITSHHAAQNKSEID